MKEAERLFKNMAATLVFSAFACWTGHALITCLIESRHSLRLKRTRLVYSKTFDD